jgi:rRNA maturation protein Nop10
LVDARSAFVVHFAFPRDAASLSLAIVKPLALPAPDEPLALMPPSHDDNNINDNDTAVAVASSSSSSSSSSMPPVETKTVASSASSSKSKPQQRATLVSGQSDAVWYNEDSRMIAPSPYSTHSGRPSPVSIPTTLSPSVGSGTVKGDVGALAAICPVSGDTMSSALQAFAVLHTCGHVFSSRAFKQLKMVRCAQCMASFTLADVIPLCGSKEQVCSSHPLYFQLSKESYTPFHPFVQ